jgi:hypothetical protein
MNPNELYCENDPDVDQTEIVTGIDDSENEDAETDEDESEEE